MIASPQRATAAVAVWPSALVLVAAVVLAYANSLNGPFVFDDVAALTQNPTIERLWPVWRVFDPPQNLTVTGRPVANFSFALNHALGGTRPAGYHLLNLLIHAGAALALFGIVRRTLTQSSLTSRFGADALPLALAVAAVWALHPLQTESVTYVVQRVESLMGLFYLMTLYAFVRSTDSGSWRGWRIVSVVACYLGMGTKEVMVSAPLVVLLYDRTLVAGSFRAAWRARSGYYLTLAASWLLLLLLVWRAADRGGTAGLGVGVAWWQYFLIQCRAIVLYLQLAVVPHPLVFDYGTPLVREPLAVAPQAALLAVMAGATGWAIVRRSVWGLLGFWFFAILSPSSSIVPVITQSIAEHRMYLPLVAIVTVGVAGSYRWLGRRSLAVWLLVAVGFGWLTIDRNTDYRSEEALWRDTIAKNSQSPRAYNGLGNALAEKRNYEEAAEAFREAVRVDAGYAEGHNNFGAMLQKLGRPVDAEASFRRALRLNPVYSAAHFNLATLLVEQNRPAEARPHFAAVLQHNPAEFNTLFHLGDLEMNAGNWAAAERHFRAAVDASSAALPARFSLAFVLAQQGRMDEAIAAMKAAVAADPQSAVANYNLGNAYVQARRLEDATMAFLRAVELDPKMTAAHYNLGNTLALTGRFAEAVAQFEQVLALDPQHPSVEVALAEARRRLQLR